MKNYLLPALMVISFGCSNNTSKSQDGTQTDSTAKETETAKNAGLDTALYDRLQTHLANGDTTGKWPVKHEYPLAGAILPSRPRHVTGVASVPKVLITPLKGGAPLAVPCRTLIQPDESYEQPKSFSEACR